MRQDVEQEEKLRRYLLGELTLEEQVLIEERLFLDSGFAEVAQAVEDDLVDEYVHGDLTAIEREKFENHIKEQPEQNDNLRIAHALKQYLDSVHPSTSPVSLISVGSPDLVEQQSLPENPDDIPLPSTFKRKPILWFALAATVLIVLSIITWIGIQSVRRRGSEPLQSKEREPVQPNPSNEQIPSPTLPVNRDERVERRDNEPNEKPANERKEKPPPRQAVLATLLPSGGSRGEGQTTKLTIPPNLGDVTLRLAVILMGYDQYRFELARDGQTIHVGDLKPQVQQKWGRVVFVTVPTRLLTEQSYEIKLRGLASSGLSPEETIYTFTVEKEAVKRD